MNKINKLLALFAIISLTANAQDNPTSLKDISSTGPFNVKKFNFRMHAGPELTFLLDGDNSVMKGGKIGADIGIEMNTALGKRTYGIIGANFISSGFERWVNNDPTVKSKMSYDKYQMLEVPVGFGLNFGDEVPQGLFAQFTAIGAYTLGSESNFTIVPLTRFEASSNVEHSTIDALNYGAKAEVGVKTQIEGNKYSSFSLSAKTMFLNRTTTNTNQYTTLNIAALFGFYF